MPFSTARTRNGPNAVAPLWHTRPIGPVRPDAPREVEVAQMSCLTFASPRQLGPLIRMPEARAKSPNSPCKSRRSSTPRSANPAEITIADPVPLRWLSWRTSSTLVVGHHDAHHVGGLRQVRHTRVGLHPHDFVITRVHGINPHPVFGFERRSQKPPAILHPRRRAHDRNGARVEHFVDRRHLWFCPELHDTP